MHLVSMFFCEKKQSQFMLCGLIEKNNNNFGFQVFVEFSYMTTVQYC